MSDQHYKNDRLGTIKRVSVLSLIPLGSWVKFQYTLIIMPNLMKSCMTLTGWHALNVCNLILAKVKNRSGYHYLVGELCNSTGHECSAAYRGGRKNKNRNGTLSHYLYSVTSCRRCLTQTKTLDQCFFFFVIQICICPFADLLSVASSRSPWWWGGHTLQVTHSRTASCSVVLVLCTSYVF